MANQAIFSPLYPARISLSHHDFIDIARGALQPSVDCRMECRLPFFMRTLFVVLLAAALGALAWIFRAELAPHFQKVAGSPAPPTVAPEPPSSAPVTPGVFFAKERIVSETPHGVKALRPGEEVRIMYRHRDGRMLVTNGHDEFTVPPSAVTRDRTEAARAASAR
jgi:hypothetical protein